MTRFEEANMRAIAAGLFDREIGVDPNRLDWAIGDLTAFLRAAGPRTSLIFRVALFAVAWMPIFFIGRFGPFSRLSVEDQARYLKKLDRSRVAALLLLPKAIFSLVYFEHPDSLKEIGFDGSCMMGVLPEGVGLVHIAPSKKHAA
jgi:hypothetical protein